MHAIAFVAQKGGAGKSTLAACLSVIAHEEGAKVFVIDLDPQGSLVDWGTLRTGQCRILGPEALALLASPHKEQQFLRNTASESVGAGFGMAPGSRDRENHRVYHHDVKKSQLGQIQQ